MKKIAYLHTCLSGRDMSEQHARTAERKTRRPSRPQSLHRCYTNSVCYWRSAPRTAEHVSTAGLTSRSGLGVKGCPEERERRHWLGAQRPAVVSRRGGASRYCGPGNWAERQRSAWSRLGAERRLAGAPPAQKRALRRLHRGHHRSAGVSQCLGRCRLIAGHESAQGLAHEPPLLCRGVSVCW